LEQTCTIAQEPEKFLAATIQLFGKEFSKEDLAVRQQALALWYNNERNAAQLISLIDFGVEKL